MTLKTQQMPLRIPVTLHQALKLGAEREGVSLNQYCLYLLSSQAWKEEGWKTKRGEDLLFFLEESKALQKELDKSRPIQKKPMGPQETPLKRQRRLYGHT